MVIIQKIFHNLFPLHPTHFCTPFESHFFFNEESIVVNTFFSGVHAMQRTPSGWDWTVDSWQHCSCGCSPLQPMKDDRSSTGATNEQTKPVPTWLAKQVCLYVEIGNLTSTIADFCQQGWCGLLNADSFWRKNPHPLPRPGVPAESLWATYPVCNATSTAFLSF